MLTMTRIVVCSPSGWSGFPNSGFPAGLPKGFMTRHSEVLSEIVTEIRRLRIEGAGVFQIARALKQRGLSDIELKRHIDAAFSIDIINPMYLYDNEGQFKEASFNRIVEPLITAAGEGWQRAKPYPGLLRRRDRHAFRALARETGTVVIVQAALPEAARYVGQNGFRPFPLHLLDVASLVPPHAGLVAADPESAELREALGALRPALSYQGYLERLSAEGFAVAGPGEGFIIRDREGTRFYPGYRLLGVYRGRSGASAWTGAEGEKIRWMLNRRMGEDLVQFGPHDDWEGRRCLEPGHPLRGPFSPALFFTSEGNVMVEFDAESIRDTYRFFGIDWDALYPNEPEVPAHEEVN
jgi:hypothetical protein